MKKILFALLILLAAYLHLRAQNGNPVYSSADMQKLMQMSPAEREQYRQKMLKQLSGQARQLAGAHDIKIDETRLPDFEIKAPPKDLKRLAMLPLSAPSKMELMAGVQKSLEQIQSRTGPEIRQEVSGIVSRQDAPDLQRTSVALWYQDKPVEALLTSIASVQKSPDQVISWNNLAALYNMAGLEEKAVPILMHYLQELPDNSLLLNNIGQSFLGLGDIGKAEAFFQHCLAIDDGNPEANRAMGMIHLFRKESEMAQKYFEKELEVAHRRSTLALMKRNGMTINLSAIRKRRAGIPHRDDFEEIGLGKFRMPDWPTASGQSDSWFAEQASYMKSLQAEFLFWSGAGEVSEEMRRAEGRRPVGLYADLEEELNSELGDTFSPLLGLLTESETGILEEMIRGYYQKLSEIKCPEPPSGPNVGRDVILAYQKKCCDMKKAVADEYVAKRNSFLRNRFTIVDARWREYINGMISNTRLNATLGNQRAAYHTVAGYFSFLLLTIQTMVSFEPAPSECYSNDLSSEEADEIIATSHSIDFNCPQWLTLDVDLKVAKLKASCSSYGIEAGQGLQAGYEKNFTTGTSTISAGVGVEQKFGSFVKVGAKQLLYISFDNNNQFSDFGLKGSAEGKIGLSSEQLVVDGIGKLSTTVAAVEGGYTLGINSGFQAGVKGKGILSGYFQ